MSKILRPKSNQIYAINIKNFTNREYDQRGFGDVSVMPADPITVYFGATYQR